MKNEIKIDVVTKVSIPKSTADVCLKLVENYCNDVGAIVEIIRNDDGTYTYEFVYTEAKIGGLGGLMNEN